MRVLVVFSRDQDCVDWAHKQILPNAGKIVRHDSMIDIVLWEHVWELRSIPDMTKLDAVRGREYKFVLFTESFERLVKDREAIRNFLRTQVRA